MNFLLNETWLKVINGLTILKFFSIYITGLVLKYMLKQGGISFFEERNIRKAKLLYSTILESRGFYNAIINKDSQSRVNVPFRVGGPKGDERVEKKFVEEAKLKGLDGLAGHRYI